MATTVENTIQYVLKLKDEFTAALGGASTKAKNFSADLVEGINVGAAAFNGLAKVASETAQIMEGDYSKIGDIFRMIPGPVGEAAGSIAGFAGSAVENLLAVTDKFDKLSQKTGASIEFLSQFTEAADDVRVSAESVEGGLTKFSRALGGVVSAEDGMVLGGKNLVQTLRDLGVEAENSNGKLKSMEEILPQVANVFMQMPDGAQKTALAIQLFGRNGAELIPILSKGADEMKRMMGEAEKLGTSVGKLDKETMAQLKRQQDNVSDSMKATEMQIARGLLPTIGNLSQGYAIYTGLMVDNNRESNIFNRTLQNISSTFMFWTGQLKEAQPEMQKWSDAYVDSLDRVEKRTIEFKPPPTPMGDWIDAYADSLSRVTKPQGEVITQQQMLEQAGQLAAKAQDALAKSVLGLKGSLTGVTADIKPVQQLEEMLGLMATGDTTKFEKNKAAASIGEAVKAGTITTEKGAELLTALETNGRVVKSIFDELGPAGKAAYEKMQETIDLYLKNKPKLSAAGLGGDAVTFKDIPEGGQDRAINPERYKERADVVRAQVEEPIKMSFVAVGLDPIKTTLDSIPSEKTVTIRVRGVSEGGASDAERRALEEESLRLARAAAAAGGPR